MLSAPVGGLFLLIVSNWIHKMMHVRRANSTLVLLSITQFVYMAQAQDVRQKATSDLPVTPPPSRIAADVQRIYDDVMLKLCDEQDLVGVSLAVARDGRLIYARGFGYADLAGKLRSHPTPAFESQAFPNRSHRSEFFSLSRRGNYSSISPCSIF